MKGKIHIVSFDVPYPADYGGVIDVYYRCKALSDYGFEVILHCFDYGRGRPLELKNISSKVYYYERKSSISTLLSKLPMIVKTRENPVLLSNLLKDTAPIIFEGQHCTAFINHPTLKKRIKFVRCHNVESHYYQKLAEVEKSFLKRVFFKLEAKKLAKQEATFTLADMLFTVSNEDQKYFVRKYDKSEFLAVANPLSKGKFIENKEDYVLMHGNLSVMENEYAIRWVLENVHPQGDFNLYVAGKSPASNFENYLKNHPGVKLFVSPSDDKLTDLIEKARVNLLITFQNTGIKHKLINALSNGGFVVANKHMLSGTKMEDFCLIADEPSEIIQKIEDCFSRDIEISAIEKRRNYLSDHYGLKAHARQIESTIKELEKESL